MITPVQFGVVERRDLHWVVVVEPYFEREPAAEEARRWNKRVGPYIHLLRKLRLL